MSKRAYAIAKKGIDSILNNIDHFDQKDQAIIASTAAHLVIKTLGFNQIQQNQLLINSLSVSDELHPSLFKYATLLTQEIINLSNKNTNYDCVSQYSQQIWQNIQALLELSLLQKDFIGYDDKQVFLGCAYYCSQSLGDQFYAILFKQQTFDSVRKQRIMGIEQKLKAVVNDFIDQE